MAGVQATPEARRLALEWVKNNPTHPVAIQYMQQVARQNAYGGMTARRYMEQGLGRLTGNPLTKPEAKPVSVKPTPKPTTKPKPKKK